MEELKMSKVYAMQVDPAFQGMGICDSVEAIAEMFDFGDEFIIKGNRDYDGYASEKIKSILELLDDCYLENYEKLDELKEIETRTLNRSERKRIIELLDYYDEYYVDQEKFRCEFLEAVTGKEWRSDTIRGCVQGEWQNIYYVKDGFSKNAIDEIEAYYFNTGSEWMIFMPETKINDVSELENLDCEFSTYCTEWLDDDIRQHIADECNVNPADVVLLVIDGYVQMPKYEIRISETESNSETLVAAA